MRVGYDNAAMVILDEELVPLVFVASLSVQEAIIGRLRARGVSSSATYRDRQTGNALYPDPGAI